MLSGDELVARGTTTVTESLPELGLKDVVPNGSWLEQKQIQSALEARKHLIEVERIEKSGSLSHAVWSEELMLAKVTQKAGSYWQYMGHNRGAQVFLKPEEALFLIEVNCLQLTFNDVTVSLQQAYSLLLRSKITIVQYKVYASLARLGYKVFRYGQQGQITDYEKKINLTSNVNESTAPEEEIVPIIADSMLTGNNDNIVQESIMDIESIEDNSQSESNIEPDNIDTSIMPTTDTNLDFLITAEPNLNHNNEHNTNKSSIIIRSNEIIVEGNKDLTNEISVECNKDVLNESNSYVEDEPMEDDVVLLTPSTSSEHTPVAHKNKLQLLENRKNKPCNTKTLFKCLQNIPNTYQKRTVTIKSPDEQFLPKNVFTNQVSYVLNIDKIISLSKNIRSESTDPRPFSASEEANGDHVRRVKDSSVSNAPPPWVPNTRFAGPMPPFMRPFQFWRPRNNMPFFAYNLLFQRSFLPNMQFIPRLQTFSRPPPSPMFGRFQNFAGFNAHNSNSQLPNGSKKRKRNNRSRHLDDIKKLALRLQDLVRIGVTQTHNLEALHRLVRTYNDRYSARLRLTEQLDIINDETIIDTIELDCEEESRNKKPKPSTDDGKYEENFNKLNALVETLKELDSKTEGGLSGRVRRVFSNLLKTFNKSYKADIYLNDNHKLINRRHINLDSSDSDCVIEEASVVSGKKVKNPFNILKRLSEKPKSNVAIPSTSKECGVKDVTDYKNSNLKNIFSKAWLPGDDDFGRPEIFHRNIEHLIEYKKEEFLYEYLRTQPHEYDNWLDMKISFFRNAAQSTVNLTESVSVHEEDNTDLRSIIGVEDCTDTPSVLKKLSIISTYREESAKTSLCIDFEVYNRDVQNFRKKCRPTPHFRVLCLDENSDLPSGTDIEALHSKHDDNVALIFAVVGTGSISFLQMNPTETPVYIPKNDLDLT